MREYRLKGDPLHPEGGPLIKVKHDNDCVFCEYCKNVFWDYQLNHIYMLICEHGHDTTQRPCPHFKEGEKE